MADAPAPAKSQGKILGMPRTTGIVVIGLGALVVGYFLISRLGGKSTSGSGSGTGGSGSGGRPSYAAGGTQIVRVIKGHQGHAPKPVKHHGGGGGKKHHKGK